MRGGVRPYVERVIRVVNLMVGQNRFQGSLVVCQQLGLLKEDDFEFFCKFGNSFIDGILVFGILR